MIYANLNQFLIKLNAPAVKRALLPQKSEKNSSSNRLSLLRLKRMECFLLLLSLLLVSLFCAGSYYYLDRPIAIYMSQFHHNTVSEFSLSVLLTELVYFITLLFMLLYAYFHFVNIEHRWVEISGVLSLGIVIAFFIKAQLQYLFGRIGPRYISSNQLLFERKSSLYGFHPFMSGSFPSGHMVIFTCLLLLFSYYYPKSRCWCYLLLAVLAFLLIFHNYHFLSDVVAGTYIGALIALTIRFLLQDKFK